MCITVALRKESVDRNNSFLKKGQANNVALRKESVDRNMLFLLFRPVAGVALRKESVDRNNSLESKQIDPSGRSPQGERG